MFCHSPKKPFWLGERPFLKITKGPPASIIQSQPPQSSQGQVPGNSGPSLEPKASQNYSS